MILKKTTVRAPLFLYICRLPATHDYEMKLPHFTLSFVEDANEWRRIFISFNSFILNVVSKKLIINYAKIRPHLTWKTLKLE